MNIIITLGAIALLASIIITVPFALLYAILEAVEQSRMKPISQKITLTRR